MAIADEFSTLSMVLIAVFFIIVIRVWMLFRDLNRTMKDSVGKIAEKMDSLEHEYIKLKPKLDEINATLDQKVDYDYLEKKMHELVSVVLTRQKEAVPVRK
ncbi:hypothetical protein HY989_02485 [Candidatus Micrarchaeota archaeon]|nr:hypothetical protein [Candidatus Micrarchaeota archaeon]